MKRSFAAVVPVWLKSTEHGRNLRAVLDRLDTSGASEIWCVEQAVTSELRHHSPRLKHALVPSTRALLERARLINHVLPRIEADLVWIVDPNLMLPFAEIGRALADSVEVAIHPFSSRRRLSAAETSAWFSGALAPEQPRRERAAFGKSSFVVEREVLLALGGLSEAFVGRADEGFELVRRLKCFFRDIAEYPHEAIELWVPLSPHEAASRRDNKLIQDRFAEAIAADCDRYLRERFSSTLPVDLAHVHELARDRQRRALFRVTNPTPPPRRPCALPGSIWGITALFNPAGYRSKSENFALFRKELAEQGLPLVAVELAFGGAPFELRPSDAERVVQLRSQDVLWQKERLLNIALEHLPSDCDKVVWLDADVLFERSDWVSATARLLNELVVVQPFTRSVRLLPGERRIDLDALPIGSGEHELLHGIAFGVEAKGLGCLGRYLEHGHSGYAWAARRELLARHGLYDANVLGNGDLNIAHAMFGGARFLKTERLSEKARQHLRNWASAFYADVAGSVGSIEGTVFHLWHGQKADRRYLDRLEILPAYDYDPARDLALDERGIYRWASDKPELQRFCREYFFNRNEDATLATAYIHSAERLS